MPCVCIKLWEKKELWSCETKRMIWRTEPDTGHEQRGKKIKKDKDKSFSFVLLLKRKKESRAWFPLMLYYTIDVCGESTSPRAKPVDMYVYLFGGIYFSLFAFSCVLSLPFEFWFCMLTASFGNDILFSNRERRPCGLLTFMRLLWEKVAKEVLKLLKGWVVLVL